MSSDTREIIEKSPIFKLPFHIGENETGTMVKIRIEEAKRIAEFELDKLVAAREAAARVAGKIEALTEVRAVFARNEEGKGYPVTALSFFDILLAQLQKEGER